MSTIRNQKEGSHEQYLHQLTVEGQVAAFAVYDAVRMVTTQNLSRSAESSGFYQLGYYIQILTFIFSMHLRMPINKSSRVVNALAVCLTSFVSKSTITPSIPTLVALFSVTSFRLITIYYYLRYFQDSHFYQRQ